MSDEPQRQPTGEHPATDGELKRAVNELSWQNVGIIIGIVASVLGGARYLVVATWAQGKEHADAGVAVLRAEFAAHVQEEAQSRKTTLEQVKDQRVEVREMRQELRAVYDYMKTGREQPTLEKPLPPMDGGR